ncbi:hypothetical protein [Oleiharenicola sp. Vm1]
MTLDDTVALLRRHAARAEPGHESEMLAGYFPSSRRIRTACAARASTGI